MPKKKLTFEQALTRLEEIIPLLESNETTLESAMKLYTEGMKLSIICGESLNAYEKEIMVLQETADGLFVQKPLG